MNIAELIDRYIALQEALETARRSLAEVGGEIIQHMKDTGAWAIDHPGYDVILERPTPGYDYAILAALRERFTPEQLGRGYSPAHEETIQVPEKWDMRFIRPLTKYGQDITDIITKAMIPADPRLHIRPKKQAEKP